MIVVLALGWCAAGALLFEMRRRSALLADAAHELRGPVTALSLGLEALRRQPVARRAAGALLVELGRMQAAADDVAAAARGRRAVERPGPVELRDLLERGADAWRPAAQRRGGRVLIDWQTGSAPLRADPRRLAQAFGNVLANAVEHGGGDIAVRGTQTPRGVRVDIFDRGAADREVAPAPGRRGRGLIIAERAIANAGGRLVARDRPGGGRAVTAELPLEQTP